MAPARPLWFTWTGRATPSSRFLGQRETGPSQDHPAQGQKATGARLPIEPQSHEDATAELILGAGPAARHVGLTVDELPRDAFRIRTVKHRVLIAGRDDAALDLERNLDRSGLPVGREWATLFGAYEFLERYVGVRWYLPLDLGEVVPQRSTLVIPSVNLTDAPAKVYRDTSMGFGADDVLGPLPQADSHVRDGCQAPRFHLLRNHGLKSWPTTFENVSIIWVWGTLGTPR